MKSCINCKKQIQVSDKFCPYCGHSQNKQPSPCILYVLVFAVMGILFWLLLRGCEGGSGLDPTRQPNSTALSLPTSTSDLQKQSIKNEDPLAAIAKYGSDISRKDGMRLVYVPAGDFSMGSNSGYSDEQPVHTVTLDAFWIGQTEVTNGMYESCVSAGACSAQNKTYHNPSTGSNHFGESQYRNYPAVYVNWEDARDYCGWVGGRLPTEAEWEKAARGTSGYTYPWGNQSITHSLANYDNYKGDSDEVGSYLKGASSYGALDMAGNVWEWTADYYSENYYTSSPSTNPKGPSSGIAHVLRGGSFFAEEVYQRTSMRVTPGSAETESYGSGNWGFRCVFDD